MAKSSFRRTLVVGDIHGAHKALVQVLDRCGFDPKTDRLISLGDLTDYQPESQFVLDTLLGIPNLVAVKGNHDTWAQDWLETGERDEVWVHNGGDVTIATFEKCESATLDRYRRFLSNQVPYFIDEENRLYVHASIDHRLEMAHQSESTLFWGRELWTMATKSGMDGGPFPENLFHEIFIGHTPTNKIWRDCKPVNFGNIWNVDQGVKKTGRLSILDVETKAFWQSDYVEDLYDGLVF